MKTSACVFGGCGRKAYGARYCPGHQKHRQKGIEPKPLKPIFSPETPAKDRLLSHIAISPGGCWEWQALRDRNGYGRIRFNKRHYLAHRLSYLTFRGESGGLHVCHTCDNPPCINPEHLYLGTDADNNADKIRKGRYRNRYTGPLVPGRRWRD